MEIKGYTLHGGYYLADKVIPKKNWKEACEMKEIITLPNGKKVIAHTLSKEELKTIPFEERKHNKWYWTSTLENDYNAWCVNYCGDFEFQNIDNSYIGIRLGFKDPF